jgi:threonine/homoserine/homoserine lactone efflux protein
MSGLDAGRMAALFGALVVLAAIPSVSVLAVSARAAASGFLHGVFTTLGVVTGDIIFILLAILGLSVLADALGDLFVVVKYVGGAYLLWLGVRMWRARAGGGMERERAGNASLLSSFSTGLFITLADQKAILFYLGFFPAFVDLEAISIPDTAAIVLIATVAVGGVKLIYAYLADRASLLVNTGAQRLLNRVAGGVMIVVGVILIMKA